MSGDLHQTSADREEDAPEPPQLRSLRRLVSMLMVVMMGAILVIAVALVWRLTRSEGSPSLPPSAAELQTPAGYEVISASRAGNRLYLLMRNSETGARQIEERAADTFAVIGTYRLIPLVE